MRRDPWMLLAAIASLSWAACSSTIPPTADEEAALAVDDGEDGAADDDADDDDDGADGDDRPGDDDGPAPDDGEGEGGVDSPLLPPAPACDVATPFGPRVVATTTGLVRGVSAGATTSFAGIPFAAPPVGDLRFAPPAPVGCWQGVEDADAPGPMCAQRNLFTGLTDGQEDCLTLNVWTPDPAVADGGAAAAPGRPVLFWIHGGGNVLGSSSDDFVIVNYDGEELATKHDVVVVSANYRLGAFGFLVSDALADESPAGVSGNYGVLDLVAALRWVRDNAASFGGDPSRVMMFGESAGAFNTCALYASPLAEGLFATALMQSGTCAQPTVAERAPVNAEMVQALGCVRTTPAEVRACIRAVPFEDWAAVGTFPLPGSGISLADEVRALKFGPSVDGHVLPLSPQEALETGAADDVPFVLGSNADEGNLFVLPGSLLSCSAYRDRLASEFGALAGPVEEVYPCDLFAPHAAYSQVVTDLVFTCPTRRAARAAAQSGTRPVYRYLFTHERVFGATSTMGAHHAAEIPFVFGSVGDGASDVATPAEHALSDEMQLLWTRFAATGDPNVTGAPFWERYDPARDNALALDTTTSGLEGFRAVECDFWDDVHAGAFAPEGG